MSMFSPFITYWYFFLIVGGIVAIIAGWYFYRSRISGKRKANSNETLAIVFPGDWNRIQSIPKSQIKDYEFITPRLFKGKYVRLLERIPPDETMNTEASKFGDRAKQEANK